MPFVMAGLTRPSPETGTMRRAADHADASGDGRVKPSHDGNASAAQDRCPHIPLPTWVNGWGAWYQSRLASSSARSPASRRDGLGGQPLIVRSTGTLLPVPPSTA